jgi:hypothetical protein
MQAGPQPGVNVGKKITFSTEEKGPKKVDDDLSKG